MNGRDKIMLAGAALILAGLATTAALSSDEATEEPVVADIEPGTLVRTDVTTEDALLGTRRLLKKATPVEEIPQDMKEAENYLKKRWGHMGDAGLMAPGVMPEGDQYFVDKKLVSGVRGNGKPIYAKTYVRAHKFTGPVMNAGDQLGTERLPELKVDTSILGRMQESSKRLLKKTGTSIDKPGSNMPKSSVSNKLNGSGYAPRPKAQAGEGIK